MHEKEINTFGHNTTLLVKVLHCLGLFAQAFESQSLPPLSKNLIVQGQ